MLPEPSPSKAPSVNNAATLILDGASSSITYGGADALASTFSGNWAAGTFEILNGRNFTTAGAFSNEGTIDVGAGSILTVGGTFTNTGNLDINGTLSAQSIAIGAGQALSGWDRAIVPSATTWRGVSVLPVGQKGT